MLLFQHFTERSVSMPLPILIIICIGIVVAIAAAFGFAVSKGYQYKHTVDPLPTNNQDENIEQDKKADTHE